MISPTSDDSRNEANVSSNEGYAADQFEDFYSEEEEAEDIADADAVWARIQAGEPTIPHDQLMAELGLGN